MPAKTSATTSPKRLSAVYDDAVTLEENNFTSFAISLDVLANDPRKTKLYSVGAYTGNDSTTASRLKTADTLGIWETVMDSAGHPLDVRIMNNKIELNLKNWFTSYGYAGAESLGHGETHQVTFAYATADTGSGKLLGWNMVTLTLIGSNDAPQIMNPPTGTIHENLEGIKSESGILGIGGSFSVQDPDLHDELAASIASSGTLGTLTVQPATGDPRQFTWTYAVQERALDFLAQDELLAQDYILTVSDGHGGIAQQSVTITLYGANDAPVITSAMQTVSIDEKLGGTTGFYAVTAAPIDASGEVTATDIDRGDRLGFSIVGAGLYGNFTLVDGGQTGQWTYSLREGDYALQHLAAGSSLRDTVAVIASDDHGGVARQDVSVEIQGVNNAPRLVKINPSPVEWVESAEPLTATGKIALSDSDSTEHALFTSVSIGGSYQGDFSKINFSKCSQCLRTRLLPAIGKASSIGHSTLEPQISNFCRRAKPSS